MSEKLPRITADEVIRVYWKELVSNYRGRVVATKSKNLADKRVTVPYHKGRVLHPKVLSSILQDAQLSKEDFIKILENK